MGRALAFPSAFLVSASSFPSDTSVVSGLDLLARALAFPSAFLVSASPFPSDTSGVSGLDLLDRALAFPSAFLSSASTSRVSVMDPSLVFPSAFWRGFRVLLFCRGLRVISSASSAFLAFAPFRPFSGAACGSSSTFLGSSSGNSSSWLLALKTSDCFERPFGFFAICSRRVTMGTCPDRAIESTIDEPR